MSVLLKVYLQYRKQWKPKWMLDFSKLFKGPSSGTGQPGFKSVVSSVTLNMWWNLTEPPFPRLQNEAVIVSDL